LRLDGGRVPMKYKPGDTRVYLASPANVTALDGSPLARGAPLEPSTVAPRKARPARTAKKPGHPGSIPPPPEGAIAIHTDGACSGNPGPAGLGVVIEDGAAVTELGEFLGDDGTNNLAELTAILRALEMVLDRDRTVVVYTDSQYAIGVLVGGWKAKLHLALIARIRARLASFRDVRLVYVRGHAGVPGNEKADALARAAILKRGTVRSAD
jgi:ribonuclease HI